MKNIIKENVLRKDVCITVGLISGLNKIQRIIQKQKRSLNCCHEKLNPEVSDTTKMP
jgi:hypothetical protein